ncbi:MAG: hypothetical protein QOJ89_3679 [bacterium]|jgi:hypothetical protein
MGTGDGNPGRAAQRPRLAVSGPMLRGSGELHIVGRDRLLTLSDPDGAVHALLALADGSRNRSEILAALAIGHPLLAEHDVDETLRELEYAGLIEDCMPHRRRPGCNLRSWGVESGLSRSTSLQ